MNKIIIILFFIAIKGHFVFAQDYSFYPKYSKVLKKEIFKNGSGQKSRHYPPNISEHFTPTKTVIKQLMKNFKKLLQLKSDSCCNPTFKLDKTESFAYQFWGLVISGKRYVYVNAFRLSEDNKIPRSVSNWKKEPVNVFDGGKDFWGAMFDVESYEFLELTFNGPPAE